MSGCGFFVYYVLVLVSSLYHILGFEAILSLTTSTHALHHRAGFHLRAVLLQPLIPILCTEAARDARLHDALPLSAYPTPSPVPFQEGQVKGYLR